MTIKKTSLKTTASNSDTVAQNNFPIVAIGASAGGLEAMMELLNHLPADTGMAFIYVQHLSPDHKSMLTEILSKKTQMKVQDIDDMDKIKPNNVFVIPYNKGIEVTDGLIKLISRSESASAISIDILFSSLAHAQKERVIGIILSGSASDGTVGVKDIKHEGGLTFAQDETARFTSMPHSAIAAGVIDFVLSPKEIACELARLSKHPFVKRHDKKTNNEDLIDSSNPDLKLILNQLFKVTGVDFGDYKMNTIKRRISRRMLLYKLTDLKDYAQYLIKNNEETDILYQDLLINVTRFFRDTETHAYLKKHLFPKLLNRKNEGESLRVWVPACATGEEAYSLAMMFLEINEKQPSNTVVQIFATDLSEHAVSKARVGVYTKQELETVSPKRIQRYFTKADGSFRVNKAVRDMCLFAPHNILSDPPFSRLDFISCCNLFIYLDTAAKKKAVNTFHYALNSEGFLMLGKSEDISHSANLFKISNSKFKIFARKANLGQRRLPELSRPSSQKGQTEKNGIAGNASKLKVNFSISQQELDKAIDDVLVSEFLPSSVVINHQMEIVQFRGTTEVFLSHPKGKATFNILKMARPEIAFELRNTISKVIRSNQRLRKTGIELKVNSEVKVISIEIVPLNEEPIDIGWNEPLLLIIFNDHEQAKIYSHQDNGSNNTSIAKDQRIKKLEQELAEAQADALSISQEQEAFNEELQSAHEEVVSSNEELQTVNEELETSKEEIESTNEELITSNQELQTRIDLLNESYEYSNAIVSTMHDSLLVLGKDLRVKSANEAFYSTFGVTEKETEGVLLYELGDKQWNIPELLHLLQNVIPSNSEFYNFEVKNTFKNVGEKIMSLNASRVIQKTHREELILLIITDITEVRRLVLEKERVEKELLKREIHNRKAEKTKLEKAVKERTQELHKANTALDARNTELLNINKELKAFTYVSSHDLQEPLRKLQTFAGLILDREKQNLSDKGQHYFELMQRETERMRQLIHDLLSFSGISVGERKFEKIELNSIVEEVKGNFKDLIAEKNAVIEIHQTCQVYIIPFQFRQLMNNLIGNALKYSHPERPPHIIVKSRNVKYEDLNIEELSLQTDYCQITISDNGIGFEQKFSSKIFEVLQKLHGKDEYPGTGIGLAIVKKIVDNHNGHITASSTLNNGATFTIFIPISQKNK